MTISAVAIPRTTQSHDELIGVSIDDHHDESHALASHSSEAHAELSAVGTDDHHAQSHALASHSSEAHSELSGVGVNDHHAQSHTAGSHSDATGLCRIATGTYTGDGTTSQAITGLGSQVRALWIQQRRTGQAAFAAGDIWFTADVIMDDIAGGAANSMEEGAGNASAIYDDRVIALGADGFTVDDDGADLDPNSNTIIYNWIAWLDV